MNIDKIDDRLKWSYPSGHEKITQKLEVRGLWERPSGKLPSSRSLMSANNTVLLMWMLAVHLCGQTSKQSWAVQRGFLSICLLRKENCVKMASYFPAATSVKTCRRQITWPHSQRFNHLWQDGEWLEMLIIWAYHGNINANLWVNYSARSYFSILLWKT